MVNRFKQVLLLLLGIAAAGFLWRFFSRRETIPCPPWLGWLLDNPFTNSRAGPRLLDRLDLQPGMSVLDVGCGPGRLAVPAAQRVSPGGSVVALDLQEEMLRRARARAAAAGVDNISFIHAAAGSGRLPHTTFDRALLITVLGEIPDRGAALSEIHDALKPGGYLLVAELLPDPHYQRRSTVQRLGREAGFVVAGTTGTWLAHATLLARPAPLSA